ncbi:cytidylyltransferase-like domain-containing protein [Ditylenchus destructor]|uniref:choline-phosphate cytidylyltransferase n=1 Tax=Ditylenchus destructor TaxID=166010 RepID=A0AAD4NJC5_9BILA|nr:cytidylyltransferase-like domain-containing protein [Ditylenchus destructor]
MADYLKPAPFSEDETALARKYSLGEKWQARTFAECQQDEMKIVRIYSDGVYDLFHNGHAEQLRQAKTFLPNTYLIVGVCTDDDVLAYKGTPPVMNHEERCAIVSHCRYVDEVHRTPPFYPTLEFVNSIKADLVAHDAIPYISPGSFDCYAPFKERDRFLATKRTPCVSTSEVLSRIVNNFEMFEKREYMRQSKMELL